MTTCDIARALAIVDSLLPGGEHNWDVGGDAEQALAELRGVLARAVRANERARARAAMGQRTRVVPLR